MNNIQYIVKYLFWINIQLYINYLNGFDFWLYFCFYQFFLDNEFYINEQENCENLNLRNIVGIVLYISSV